MLEQIGPGVWANRYDCSVSVDLREALDAAGMDCSAESCEAMRQKIIGMAETLFPRVKLDFHEHGFPLRN